VPEIFGLATGYWILVVVFVVVGLLYLIFGRYRREYPDDDEEDSDER
jgi:hypothetical protein